MPSPFYRLRLPAVAAVALVAALLCVPPGAPAQHHDGHGPAEKAGADEHGHGAPAAKGHEDVGKKKERTGIEHVMDDRHGDVHLFDVVPPQHIHLPAIPMPWGEDFQITKFMVLEVIAALLIIVIYVPLARRLRTGEPARGPFANSFEVLLTFVRDQIAKPNLGEDADRYVPFLWTLFLFILFNNLLGMVPFLGSATASIYVTLGLAVIAFFAIHGSAILAMARGPAHGHDDHGHGEGHGHDHHGETPHAERPSLLRGLGRYIQSLWPQIDLPLFPLGLPIKVLVFLLDVMGVLVRNGVLAIRLFANMFAGHMVTATILIFIAMAANAPPLLWGAITVSSVLGIVALSLLELFVAFLQAYIFTFLTSLFMGMAIHPQH
jgi:F-type H+-transporting ATPase subunit a